MGKEQIRRAAVIGSGQMGPGIAYALAVAGCEVCIVARTEKSVRRGLAAFAAASASLTGAGCVRPEEAARIEQRVSGSTDFEAAAAAAGLIVESIPEDLALKRDLFAALERVCSTGTIVTSNTSGLPATDLAEGLAHPQRFAVTHFWNPPHLMPLVEIVKGAQTSEETVATLDSLMRAAGKMPVTVLKDTPGQLGVRLFHALIREAIHIVQEGIATAEDVDRAVMFGLGRRFPVYGALEHQDVSGLDMVCAIQDYLCRALCSDSEPARLLRDKVASGDLGVKSGRGFYDWSRRDAEALIARRDRFLLDLMKRERT